jgi:hypothetical protein
MIVEEIRSEFYPSQLPMSYRVAPTTDVIDEEILRSQNIDTIRSDFQDFQKSAALALAGSRVSSDALKRIQEAVPSELLPAFDRNPAAVDRLLNSWEYVNQAPFTATGGNAVVHRFPEDAVTQTIGRVDCQIGATMIDHQREQSRSR